MEENVLVDSSFYISQLRQGLDPFQAFAEADDRYEFYSCGVVLVEVCCGIIQPKAYQQIRNRFELMCWVPTTSKIWEKVTQLAWELARKGIIMKVPDLTIAVSALEADASVLTYDSDFTFVPNLRVISRLE
jgi:predicted nucleic acid-binding protein